MRSRVNLSILLLLIIAVVLPLVPQRTALLSKGSVGTTVGGPARRDAEILADPAAPAFVKKALRQPIREVIGQTEVANKRLQEWGKKKEAARLRRLERQQQQPLPQLPSTAELDAAAAASAIQ